MQIRFYIYIYTDCEFVSQGSLSDDVKKQINESMKNVLDDSLIAALNAAVDGVIRRSFQPGDSDQALTDAVKNDLRDAVDGVLNDDLRIQLFHGILETLQNVSNNNREATSNQQEVKDAVWSAIGLAMDEAVDNAVTESFEHL